MSMDTTGPCLTASYKEILSWCWISNRWKRGGLKNSVQWILKKADSFSFVITLSHNFIIERFVSRKKENYYFNVEDFLLIGKNDIRCPNIKAGCFVGVSSTEHYPLIFHRGGADNIKLVYFLFLLTSTSNSLIVFHEEKLIFFLKLWFCLSYLRRSFLFLSWLKLTTWFSFDRSTLNLGLLNKYHLVFRR